MAPAKATPTALEILTTALAWSNVIDISMELNEKTVVWVADPQPKLIPVLRQPLAPVNFTWLDFGAHAGTHVDAPFYLFLDKWTTDQIPLDRLIGTCQVIDLTEVADVITSDHLKAHEITRPIVLLRTKNSFDPMEAYNPRHVAMTVEAAEYCIQQGVTTLGFDYQSFERDGSNDVHHAFLSKSVTLVDNLRLKDAAAGEYLFICLPVKGTGIAGAPARAILIDNPELR